MVTERMNHEHRTARIRPSGRRFKDGCPLSIRSGTLADRSLISLPDGGIFDKFCEKEEFSYLEIHTTKSISNRP